MSFAGEVKVILLSLFIPPVGLVTLALAGLLIQRHRPVLGHRMVWLAFVGLFALATPAVSGSLLVALERNLPTIPPAADPPMAIVVLGAEIARIAGEPPTARVGRMTLERLRTAAALQRKTQLPILVSGGITQAGVSPVGMLMAESLREDFQVPVRWIEPHSRDTWENAEDSAAILRAQGIRSVYVVTHPWHMRRALMAFAHTGLAATAAPIPLDHAADPTWSDFLPRVSNWENGFLAMHEWIGCAWYGLR